MRHPLDPDQQLEVFTPDEHEAIRQEIHAQLVPVRVRFYLIVAALIGVVFIAAFSYLAGRRDLQSQFNRLDCSMRVLVIHATPTTPRAKTTGGRHLHYTPAQKRAILAIRADLLSTLPPASCPQVVQALQDER